MTFPKAFQINTLLSDGPLRTQDASRQAEASPRMCMCVCVCECGGALESLPGQGGNLTKIILKPRLKQSIK